MKPLAKHDLLVISDADVRVPPDLLANLVRLPARAALVRPPGLACCFYRLANPATLAMRWEAIAINADFWSQVLQSRSLKPIDFALGAVMALPRSRLEEIGGFKALADCLADDYQLGNRIARRGHPIVLCPVVVDCWSAPMGWAAVWKHQLRWARTIRVCQAAPYFFSILSNATLWPLVWVAAKPAAPVFGVALFCCAHPHPDRPGPAMQARWNPNLGRASVLASPNIPARQGSRGRSPSRGVRMDGPGQGPPAGSRLGVGVPGQPHRMARGEDAPPIGRDARKVLTHEYMSGAMPRRPARRLDSPALLCD